MKRHINPLNNLTKKEDIFQKWIKDILQKYEEKVRFVTLPICERTLSKVIEELKGIKITIEPDKKISTFDEGFLMPIKGGFIIKHGTLASEQEKFSDVRIRATICHELAHILFYDCTSLIPKLQAASPEDWCHDIARNLLLPTTIVKEKFSEKSKTNSSLIDIIEELSRGFQVSRMLTVKKLTEDLSLVKDTMITFWRYVGEQSNNLNDQIRYKDYQRDPKLSPDLKKLLPEYWRDKIHREAWDKVVSKVAVNSVSEHARSLYLEGKNRKSGKIKSIPFTIHCKPLYGRSNNLHFSFKNYIIPTFHIISVKKFDLNALENGKEVISKQTYSSHKH